MVTSNAKKVRSRRRLNDMVPMIVGIKAIEIEPEQAVACTIGKSISYLPSVRKAPFDFDLKRGKVLRDHKSKLDSLIIVLAQLPMSAEKSDIWLSSQQLHTRVR